MLHICLCHFNTVFLFIGWSSNNQKKCDPPDQVGLDAELSKKEELISALGEYFPMSPELVAHAEKAKELDGLTVNQLKAVLRHLELEHGGVRPVLWERLMPHLPLTDAAKTVAQKAKQIDAAAAAAKLAAQKAKQTAAPSTTTTDEPATESADVANGGGGCNGGTGPN
jgi:hypothetical protein